MSSGDAAWWARLACWALLGAGLVVGGLHLRAELRAMRTFTAKVAATPRDHGQPVQVGSGGERMGFLDFGRRTAPAGASIRIAQPSQADPRVVDFCRQGPGGAGERFWLVYSLVPRPRTCDPGARWTVYLGIRPGRLPAGPRLHACQPDLAVVELASAGR
jgi:hypothetical protein